MIDEREQSDSANDVCSELIELQLSLCGSYVILAKRATDPLQALSFRDKARAALDEAQTLSERLTKSDARSASFEKEARSMRDRLLELDAILDAKT